MEIELGAVFDIESERLLGFEDAESLLCFPPNIGLFGESCIA